MNVGLPCLSAACLLGLIGASSGSAAEPVAVEPVVAASASYDPALAKRLGADQRGMRQYVLVILKTGPNKMPEGEQRKAMFAGHFANMQRLAKAGKLIMAGPFSDEGEWRGLFVFAVETIQEARQLTATDPVIVNGEMVGEFHRWYGSAATMMLPEIDARLSPPAK